VNTYWNSRFAFFFSDLLNILEKPYSNSFSMQFSMITGLPSVLNENKKRRYQ